MIPDEIIRGSFAEGLFLMGQKNIVEPVRMNKAMRQILLSIIEDEKSRTSTMFEDDDEIGLDRFLKAMEYLTQVIGGKSSLNRIKLTKAIAWQLSCFIWNNDWRYYKDKEKVEFDKSMQWIAHHIYKRYSQFEIAQWGSEEK